MSGTLTKTGVQFDRIRVIKREGEVPTDYDYFVEVRYVVLASEGEQWSKTRVLELAGARKTTLANLFTNLEALLKTDEGIT